MKDLLTTGLALVGAYAVLDRLGVVGGPRCPEATRNIGVNTRNRQIAIDKFLYGPLNPAQPSESYWRRLASVWSRGSRVTDVEIREVVQRAEPVPRRRGPCRCTLCGELGHQRNNRRFHPTN